MTARVTTAASLTDSAWMFALTMTACLFPEKY
jgi:hypothetical protein